MLQTLFAQGPPAGGENPGGLMGSPFMPLFMIGLMVLFWVVVVLPASRRQRREQQAMLAGLKRGSKVVTSAGIIGTVVTARDGEEEIVVRSEDARFRVLRSSIIRVLGTDEAEAAKS